MVDPGPSPGGSVITRLVPGRTVVGDTVRVEGTGFGADEASGTVTFAGGSGRVEATALSWSASSIAVLVPTGALSGPVSVAVEAQEGTALDFSVASQLISYASDLLPVFEESGCVDCHSGDFGEAHLRLESVAGLMLGASDHGPVVIPRDGARSILVPVVIPRDGARSILVRKVSSNPLFGGRMPLGCSQGCFDDGKILAITDWIDQGARDN